MKQTRKDTFCTQGNENPKAEPISKNGYLRAFLILAVFFLAISRADSQKIYTYAGSGVTGYTDSGGVASLAEFNHPWGLAIDRAGNLFVADHVNSCIRKITKAGVVSTFAGTTTCAHAGDNGPATACMMERPAGIALDAVGNLYIADKMDNRIRKIDTAGVITTIAGTGAAGYTGDGGRDTAATFNTPTGIALDASGNIYIADSGNNVIRKINTAGIVSTVAGTGVAGYSGDGGAATAANLSGPVSVVFDAAGNIYITDNLNNVIRKVSPAQIITTFAGSGIAGYSGDGGPATAAQFFTPNSMAFDAVGNMFVSDQENAVIRMISPDGRVVTTAGTGHAGYSGDGGQAQDAQMYKPMGLAVDTMGNIYVGDFINSVVRVINVQRAGTPTLSANTPRLSIDPNPAVTMVNFIIDGAAGRQYLLHICDMAGREFAEKSIMVGNTSWDISHLPAGTYVASISSAGAKTVSCTFVKN